MKLIPLLFLAVSFTSSAQTKKPEFLGFHSLAVVKALLDPALANEAKQIQDPGTVLVSIDVEAIKEVNGAELEHIYTIVLGHCDPKTGSIYSGPSRLIRFSRKVVMNPGYGMHLVYTPIPVQP